MNAPERRSARLAVIAFGLDLSAVLTVLVVAPIIAGSLDSDSRLTTFYALDLFVVPGLIVTAFVLGLRSARTAGRRSTKVMGVSATVLSSALAIPALGLVSILVQGVGD